MGHVPPRVAVGAAETLRALPLLSVQLQVTLGLVPWRRMGLVALQERRPGALSHWSRPQVGGRKLTNTPPGSLQVTPGMALKAIAALAAGVAATGGVVSTAPATSKVRGWDVCPAASLHRSRGPRVGKV